MNNFWYRNKKKWKRWLLFNWNTWIERRLFFSQSSFVSVLIINYLFCFIAHLSKCKCILPNVTSAIANSFFSLPFFCRSIYLEIVMELHNRSFSSINSLLWLEITIFNFCFCHEQRTVSIVQSDDVFRQNSLCRQSKNANYSTKIYIHHFEFDVVLVPNFQRLYIKARNVSMRHNLFTSLR